MPKNFKFNRHTIINIFFIFILSLFLNISYALNLKTIEKNKLIVGTNATFAPFEYIAGDGSIVGFDIDLIKEVGKLMGYKEEDIKIVDMPFDGLLSALGSKIDVVIAGLTKTPEREKIVSFSDTYFEGKQNILTLKEKNIVNEDSFKNLTVATQIGTTANEVAKNIASKIQNVHIKEYDGYDVMVENLKQKKIDAIILDEIAAKKYEKNNINILKATDGSIINCPIENSCIACPKNNDELLKTVNSALLQVKNSEKYKELLKKHMDLSSEEPNKNNTPQKNHKNTLKQQFHSAFIEQKRWKLYLKGLKTTMIVTIFSAIFGFFLGTILSIIKLSKNKKGKPSIFSKLVNIYIALIRGTPVLVQLLIMWLVILKNAKSGTLVAIVAFSLNSAAYVAEIIRGGINAVDVGQKEAAKAMGFSNIQTMYYIVLPQGLRNSIPALCNEFISLLKETAVVGYVALNDLTRAAFSISAASYQTFMPLILTALLYFIVTKTASLILDFIERRFLI